MEQTWLKSHKKLRPAQGMTLLEVVVAMGLVFVALLALSGLATTAFKGAAVGTHLTTATMLAQEKLEEIKRDQYRPDIAGIFESVEAYDTIPDYFLYQRTTRIQPQMPMAGLQSVSVTVGWAKDQHGVTLSTMVAQ